MPERFVGTSQELDMLLRQLESETIAIGSPGVYQISYTFLAQVKLQIILNFKF